MAVAAVAPARATTFTSADYQSATLALSVMRNLNLYVSGNATLTSEVEGKAFIGGNLNSSWAPIGTGASANPGQKSKMESKYRTLTVGGSLTGSGVHINNNIGVAGQVEAAIGGNAPNVNFNGSGQNLLLAGGSVTGFNGSSSKKARSGVTATSSQNYITKDTTLAVGGSKDLKQTITNVNNLYKEGFSDLSGILKSLTPTASINSSDQNNIQFNFTSAALNSSYAVVNMTANQLNSGTFFAPTSYATNKAIIVNVSGSSVTFGANFSGNGWSSVNQNIIWNFTDATSVTFNTAVFGSILAPKAEIKGSNPINGSVVAKLFSSQGEVHLGTYNGTESFLLTNAPPIVRSVPEPATWSTMLTGFGAIGYAIRRRRRQARAAA